MLLLKCTIIYYNPFHPHHHYYCSCRYHCSHSNHMPGSGSSSVGKRKLIQDQISRIPKWTKQKRREGSEIKSILKKQWAGVWDCLCKKKKIGSKEFIRLTEMFTIQTVHSSWNKYSQNPPEMKQKSKKFIINFQLVFLLLLLFIVIFKSILQSMTFKQH